MSEVMVSCVGLTKQYQQVRALNQVNLTIEKGKVYGLVGRNGAGKTTLLKLMSGMLFSSEGRVDYRGIGQTSEIAYSRNYNRVFMNYSLRSLIRIAQWHFPNWNKEHADELISQFELKLKQKYVKASSGMQNMMNLVIALAAHPKLLLLDEPYVGLDPINRQYFYDFLVEHYFNQETTVIISSHLIKEIEGYFERVLMVDKGQLLIDQDIEQVRQKSYLIEGSQALEPLLSGTNLLTKQEMAGRVSYYLYGDLSESQRQQIRDYQGVVKGMDLQTLMMQIVKSRATQSIPEKGQLDKGKGVLV